MPQNDDRDVFGHSLFAKRFMQALRDKQPVSTQTRPDLVPAADVVPEQEIAPVYTEPVVLEHQPSASAPFRSIFDTLPQQPFAPEDYSLSAIPEAKR